MENSSFAFFPNSADSFSMRREAKPEPVPPSDEGTDFYHLKSFFTNFLLENKKIVSPPPNE